MTLAVLEPVPAALLWLAVASRARTLNQGHAQRALCVSLAACAVAATLEVSLVAAALHGLTGVANLGQLVKHLAALVAAGATREVVRGFALPPARAVKGAHRRVAAFGAGSAAMVLLFALAPIHEEEVHDLTARSATEPAMLAYWAVFLIFLGSGLVSMGRLAHWYRRHAKPSPLRSVLVLVELGSVAGLLYILHKVTYFGARALGVGGGVFINSTSAVSSGLFAACVILIVAGVNWLTISEHRAVRGLAAYRAYRELQPLWRDVTAAAPDVKLPPAPRQGEEHLYDRIIEIRDGVLALRPYITAQMPAEARRVARELGVSPSKREAATEAAVLEMARRAKARGDRAPSPPLSDPGGATDLDGEVRALVQIARARRLGTRIADRIEATPVRAGQAV